MQLKNKINLKWYVIGTLVNYCAAIYFLGIENIERVAFFLLLLLLNQYFLFLFGVTLLRIEKLRFAIPPFVLGLLKFAFLILAFLYGFKYMEKQVLFLLVYYIFQLIILVISIKRVIKKN